MFLDDNLAGIELVSLSVFSGQQCLSLVEITQDNNKYFGASIMDERVGNTNGKYR
jgi:hypothetical protein